jgi:hypothetical protein
MQAVVVGQYAVFIGGYDSTGTQSDKIHIFDSSNGTWLADRTLNTTKCKSRYNHAMVYVGGVIYIAGGQDGLISSHPFLSDICYIRVSNWTNWVYMNALDYENEKLTNYLHISHYDGSGSNHAQASSMAGSVVTGINCSWAVFTGGIIGIFCSVIVCCGVYFELI